MWNDTYTLYEGKDGVFWSYFILISDIYPPKMSFSDLKISCLNIKKIVITD